MKILIAEDSPESRLILEHAVIAFGHTCVMAADGVEAWEAFQQGDCSAVLSDWLMPRMDGQELCRRIRESDRPSTYFIFLTSLEDKLHLLEAQRAGADAYLTKPIVIPELKAALARAEQEVATRYQAALPGDGKSQAETEQAEPLEDVGRTEMIEQLDAMGSRYTTMVNVNGRSLSLDALITLIEQLPPTATIGRRWPLFEIKPDPFTDASAVSRPPSAAGLQHRRAQYEEQAELVRRLSQGVRDQSAIDEQRKPWWRRLVGGGR